MTTPDMQEEIRRRSRAAAERLAGAAGLREALDDAQASRLLAWGYDVLERAAARAAVQPAAPAGPTLEETAATVTRIMRLANRLVQEIPEQASETLATSLYIDFLTALQLLQELPAAVHQGLPDVVAARQHLGPTGVFQRLMALLEAGSDSPTPAPAAPPQHTAPPP